MSQLLTTLLAINPNDPQAAKKAAIEVSIYIHQQIKAAHTDYALDGRTMIYSPQAQEALNKTFKEDYDELVKLEQDPAGTLKHLNTISFYFQTLYQKRSLRLLRPLQENSLL